MKTGICPKCQSSEVYEAQNGIGAMEAHYVRKENTSTHSTFNHYVCSNCGYIESYLTNENDINFIRNNRYWKKVVLTKE